MARTDSSLERERRIRLYRRNGFTLSEIAQMEGISRPRVSQIIAAAHAELPEDETRAEIASLLEFAERKAVELINEPGFTLTAAGHVAEDPDGNPLTNKTIVDNALKTLILVADRKSRLYGADKQVLKKMDTPTAQEAMWAAIAVERQRRDAELEADRLAAKDRRELEMYRQRFGNVISGEVLPALPPGAVA